MDGLSRAVPLDTTPLAPPGITTERSVIQQP